MNLTVKLEQTPDARWRAYFEEMPEIFYLGDSPAEIRERIDRLAHALRSPHIRIDRVLPNGDVILTLSRFEDGREGQETAVRPLSALEDLKKATFSLFQRIRATA